MREYFNKFAQQASYYFGTPLAFILSLLSVLMWALAGPFFGFSQAWQLVINTGTTVITYWMVFLIQASSNKEMRAIHLKLDDLIKHSKADNAGIGLEDKTDEVADKLKEKLRE